MTKITNLDKNALKALAPAIEHELKAFAERCGLIIEYAGGQFGDGAEATLKLRLRVDDPATKLAAAKAGWDRNCRYIGVDFSSDVGPEKSGLRPEDFGTEFQAGGVTWRTTGINTGRKGSKFPIMVEVVYDPTKRLSPGTARLYGEIAVPAIRAATDEAAAKAKAA